MVFISPPCIEAPCRRGYRNRKTTLDGSTSGKGGEEFLELIVDLVLPFDGPGYLFLEEVAVAPARPVDDDLDVGFAEVQLDGDFLQGPGLSRRNVLAESVEAGPHLPLQGGQGPLDQPDGPFPAIGLLGGGFAGPGQHLLGALEVQGEELAAPLEGLPPVVLVGEEVLQAGEEEAPELALGPGHARQGVAFDEVAEESLGEILGVLDVVALAPDVEVAGLPVSLDQRAEFLPVAGFEDQRPRGLAEAPAASTHRRFSRHGDCIVDRRPWSQ